MKLNDAIRIMAFLALAASAPLAAIKLPWMPVVLVETIELYQEPYPNGSESYLADRHRLFVEDHIASGIYLLACAAAVGLLAIGADRVPPRARPACFALAIVAGVAITWYMLRDLDFLRDARPGAALVWALLLFVLPGACSAALSTIGFVLSVLPRNSASNDAWSRS